MSKEQVARDRRICGWVKLAWCSAAVFGCAYVVFWKGASGWWFLLALLLCDFKCKIRDDDTGEIVE